MLRTHHPWLTFSSVDFIRDFLRPGSGLRVFEYGSGASTLFWLDHGATVVSVEHDPTWHAQVSRLLPQSGRVDYRLVLPSAGPASDKHDPADPELFQSDDPLYRGMQFRTYVEQIEEFADGTFDIVLIDGRARSSCVAHAASKTRDGGLLVLDNSDRGYYLRDTAASLLDYETHEFAGYCPGVLERTKTDVFVKRQSSG
jgi:predicted O-methyltransferase YrrM